MKEAVLGTRASLFLGVRASRLPLLRTLRASACVPSGASSFNLYTLIEIENGEG